MPRIVRRSPALSGTSGGSNGLFVQAAVEAPPSYDSGLIELTNAVAALTALNVKGRRLHISNKTALTKKVTVTDTAGVNFWLNQYPLQAHMAQSFDLAGGKMVGIKAGADANAAVDLQITGDL